MRFVDQCKGSRRIGLKTFFFLLFFLFFFSFSTGYFPSCDRPTLRKETEKWTELVEIRIPRLHSTMLKITNFRIDAVKTPGLVHADNLTPESARETSTLLEENNSRYHIFTTTEDDKGVSEGGMMKGRGRR